jgi:DNA-binding XRE family transcriptional regulator
MHTISAAQIRAARGLLNWTQGYLGKTANVSRATLQIIEKEDGVSVRSSKIKSIQITLEKHGIEFLPDDGVKRQPERAKSFVGPDSCDEFFDDVLQTLKEKGGDFICMIDCKDMLRKASGTTRRTNLQRLEQVQKIADVKCLLLAENVLPPFFDLPTFQMRSFPEEATILPISTFVYGNKLVIGQLDHNLHFLFSEIPISRHVDHNQNYFFQRWQVAKQVLPSNKTQKICA